MGSKVSCIATIGLLVGALTLTGCSSPPTELRWPPPATPLWTPPSVNSGAPPTALMCRVADTTDEGMGVYYLEIHSAAFDFSPCDSGAARIPIRVSNPQPPLVEGPQERCRYSGATDPSVNGYVNVLSSSRPPDFISATQLCTAHHGVVR